MSGVILHFGSGFATLLDFLYPLQKLPFDTWPMLDMAQQPTHNILLEKLSDSQLYVNKLHIHRRVTVICLVTDCSTGSIFVFLLMSLRRSFALSKVRKLFL